MIRLANMKPKSKNKVNRVFGDLRQGGGLPYGREERKAQREQARLCSGCKTPVGSGDGLFCAGCIGGRK